MPYRRSTGTLPVKPSTNFGSLSGIHLSDYDPVSKARQVWRALPPDVSETSFTETPTPKPESKPDSGRSLFRRTMRGPRARSLQPTPLGDATTSSRPTPLRAVRRLNRVSKSGASTSSALSNDVRLELPGKSGFRNIRVSPLSQKGPAMGVTPSSPLADSASTSTDSLVHRIVGDGRPSVYRGRPAWGPVDSLISSKGDFGLTPSLNQPQFDVPKPDLSPFFQRRARLPWPEPDWGFRPKTAQAAFNRPDFVQQRSRVNPRAHYGHGFTPQLLGTPFDKGPTSSFQPRMSYDRNTDFRKAYKTSFKAGGNELLPTSVGGPHGVPPAGEGVVPSAAENFEKQITNKPVVPEITSVTDGTRTPKLRTPSYSSLRSKSSSTFSLSNVARRFRNMYGSGYSDAFSSLHSIRSQMGRPLKPLTYGSGGTLNSISSLGDRLSWDGSSPGSKGQLGMFGYESPSPRSSMLSLRSERKKPSTFSWERPVSAPARINYGVGMPNMQSQASLAPTNQTPGVPGLASKATSSGIAKGALSRSGNLIRSIGGTLSRAGGGPMWLLLELWNHLSQIGSNAVASKQFEQVQKDSAHDRTIPYGWSVADLMEKRANSNIDLLKSINPMFFGLNAPFMYGATANSTSYSKLRQANPVEGSILSNVSGMMDPAKSILA